MKRTKKLSLCLQIVPLLLGGFVLAGCPDDGAEEAGEAIDETIDDTEDALDDAADDVEDAVDDNR